MTASDGTEPPDMREYYAARAPEYDQVYAKPERQQDLRAIEAWLPGRFIGRRLIEIACGTGYWTRFLAPAASELLATDAAPQTLEIARRRVRSPSVQFVVADAYRLPTRAGAFSGAFAGFWLSHVPRQRLAAFLDDLHARLAPGARVVFLDNRFVAGSSTPISEEDAFGNTYQQRRLGDGSSHRVLKNFPSEAELTYAVGGAGIRLRHHAWQHYWALEYLVS